MTKIIILFTLLTINLSIASDCPKLKYDKKNYQAVEVTEIVCDVIKESYPDLLKLEIDILEIEGSKILSKFSGGKLSFISFFNGKRFSSFSKKKGYLIGYSRIKLYESNKKVSNTGLRAVLAHELAHTVLWRDLGKMGSVHYAIYTTVGNSKIRGKYERQTDIRSIARGVMSGNFYAAGLGEYRQWNYEQTDASKREYLKEVYYFQEQLIHIQSYISFLKGKARKKFISKLLRKAPVKTEEIREIYYKALGI